MIEQCVFCRGEEWYEQIGFIFGGWGKIEGRYNMKSCSIPHAKILKRNSDAI
jgi:hypothetical protein